VEVQTLQSDLQTAVINFVSVHVFLCLTTTMQRAECTETKRSMKAAAAEHKKEVLV
jgi:hypothetical protein